MVNFDIEQLASRLVSFKNNNYLSGVPLYECIRRVFQSMILEGNFSEDYRLPSDKDLAHRLGVNTRTLSKALNELRNSGLISRQRAKGTYIKVSRPESRCAIHEYGNQVAVVFDEVSNNTFQAELFVALHKQLAEQKLDLLFASSSGQAEKQFEDVQAMFVKPGCCGCIVWSIMNEAQIQTLLQVKPRNFPLIILDKEYSGLQHDCVCYDVYEAAREATKYYTARGCQNLLFIAPERRRSFMGARIEGINSLLAGKHLEVLFYKNDDVMDMEKYQHFVVITANCEALHWLSSQYHAAGINIKTLPPVATFCTPTDVLPPMPVLQLVFSARSLACKAVELLISRLRGDHSRQRRFLIGHHACVLKDESVVAV